MDSAKTDYIPINCHYYDVLELVAIRRLTVEIRYQNEAQVEQITQSRIEDLWAKNGEEFMRLSDQTVIRLDQLISVDGQVMPEAGCAWP